MRHPTLRYVALRILAGVGVMWGAATLTFVVLLLVQGDQVSGVVGTGALVTPEVRAQIVEEKARSTVAIQDVWLTVDAEDEASAIVHALSTIDSENGASAELESYLRVRLVRSGARWQVDDLTSLGSRDLSAPLPEPGSDGEGSGDESDG